MYQDEEIHAELLAEFRRYFEANQQWINEGTKASAIRLRQSLAEIRRICTKRRKAVREWARVKEAELAELEAARQARKRGEAANDSDN
jgi:uncharacterized protein YggL (DUF469 family)